MSMFRVFRCHLIHACPRTPWNHYWILTTPVFIFILIWLPIWPTQLSCGKKWKGTEGPSVRVVYLHYQLQRVHGCQFLRCLCCVRLGWLQRSWGRWAMVGTFPERVSSVQLRSSPLHVGPTCLLWLIDRNWCVSLQELITRLIQASCLAVPLGCI